MDSILLQRLPFIVAVGLESQIHRFHSLLPPLKPFAGIMGYLDRNYTINILV
jgi:hypothetical protein